MLISPAYAQATGGTMDLLSSFIPLILIFVIFYFLIIRPQQKKQKEHKNKISAIKRGDKVIVGGGIYGTVTKVDGEVDAEVEIASGVVITVIKATILDVISDQGKAPAAKAVAGNATASKSISSKSAPKAKTVAKKPASKKAEPVKEETSKS